MTSSTPGAAPTTPDARHHHGAATVSSSRLRKREADRKAQRIAREKTKNRIAHLEGLVEELSRKDDNATTVSLMTQLSRVTEQRNNLVVCLETASSAFAKQLKEVEELGQRDVSNASFDATKSALLNATMSDSSSSLDFSASSAPTAAEPNQDKMTMADLDVRQAVSDADLMNGTTLDASDLWIDGVFPSGIPELPPLPKPPTPPPPPTSAIEPKTSGPPVNTAKSHRKSTCSCRTSTRTRRLSDGSLVSHNCWKAGNEILKEPFPLTEAMLNLEYQVSEDVPVHAVLHGWDSLAQSGRMTPLWKKVRQLDELCFAGCGPPERLAVLFMIHLLMRAYTDPTPAKSAVVPQWYLKSQLQQISPGHDPSADYFTWPALRYRFATTPHLYCGNTFWHMFREHLRIAWPFDFRDCYVRNTHLGAYGLSPLFKDRLRDLRAWTMEPDFFAQYPELRQDVPQFQGQPNPMNMANPVAHRQAVGALAGSVYQEEGKQQQAADGPSSDKGDEEVGSRGDDSEEDLFGDLGVETNSDFLFFHEEFSNTMNSHDAGGRLNKHKDSSCISL